MKRLSLLLPVFFCLLSFRVSAKDTGKVSGRVLDENKKPLQYAIIALLKAADSTLVKGAIADGDGKYFFDNIEAGSYRIAVTFTGYGKSWQGPFELNGGEYTVPDISMLLSKDMKEVTITAVQPLYTQKADRLIMNVENSPVRITGSAWDLIATAPGVVVNQNNTITLRGKSGVGVYIDGRNTFLSGDPLMNYLQNISAADVVQVEIINNPPAKYDAQGSAGILNLITKKGSQQGLNGAVRVGFGQAFYSKPEAGGNFNYAKEKFNIYGKYDFGNRKNIDRTDINRNVRYNGITTNYNQHNTTISTPYSHNARLGVDFYAKHNITWGAKAEGSFADESSHAVNNTLISSSGNDSTSLLYQLNDDKNQNKNISGNLYFSQKFDTLGKELSASADYLNYNTRDNTDFNLNYYDKWGNTSAPSELQRSNKATDISIFVEQLDYSLPLGKQYKLETGLKSSYVQTSNDLRFNVFSNNIWEYDSTRSNKFVYKETINAAYGTAYATYKKWELTGGLRAEQTISDGNSPTTGQHLKKSYVQLFPSVFVLQKINSKNSINYTYSRRINRPSYQNLNPFLYYLDKYTYMEGNPYLQPETSNNFDITYSYLDAMFVSVGASRTKHGMTDVTNQVDSTGVGYQTTVNLNTVDNAYFGLFVPVPIGNWFMMENNFGLSYSHFKSDLYNTNLDNKTWMYNISSTLTFSLSKDFKIQTWGWYQSPGTYGIFHLKSQGGAGASLSKTFLDKQLSVSLAVMDIFKTNGTRVTVNFQNQDLYLKSIPESPRVALRARYSFGNKKATRKAQDKSGADDLRDRTQKKGQ